MKNLLTKLTFCVLAPCSLMFTACSTTETSTALDVATVNTSTIPYSGPKEKVVVGNFVNRSSYMRGLFSDGKDRLGEQAKTILMTHLDQSQRFQVMDRSNMENIAREAEFSGTEQSITGANYTITGSVTEFGKKTVGDTQLFGILGSGKTQVAYAKVALNIVDVRTSVVVFSGAGAGEYQLSSRQVVGFGGRSGYDSTLNGKVLDLAIREAINRIVEGFDAGSWKQ